MNTFTIILRLGLAMGLGAIIGWEREAVDKPAGLRTLTLVCVGATLFVLVTLELGNASTSTQFLDPLRTVAAIIQGIGFLGAGTVLHKGETVKGLTTAAALWAVTDVGAAVGFGMYRIAIVGTVTILVVLRPLGHLYTHWSGNHDHVDDRSEPAASTDGCNH